MKIESVGKSNFEGKVVIVNPRGKLADAVEQKRIIAQLGSVYFDLLGLIRPKPYNLFILRKGDFVEINANTTYNGVSRGDTDRKSLHKSILDKIVSVARISMEEYEKFMQKNI